MDAGAGEVHLEMCIKDLKERFARVDLHVSAPLVAFRESVFYPSEAPDVGPKPAKVIFRTSKTESPHAGLELTSLLHLDTLDLGTRLRRELSMESLPSTCQRALWHADCGRADGKRALHPSSESACTAETACCSVRRQ